MKALVRNEGETVTEKMNIAGIDWETGAPLTNPDWCGGPYTLMNNYIQQETYEAVPAETETETPDTIVIDGVTYTRS